MELMVNNFIFTPDFWNGREGERERGREGERERGREGERERGREGERLTVILKKKKIYRFMYWTGDSAAGLELATLHFSIHI
jgi:hypothetical protein